MARALHPGHALLLALALLAALLGWRAMTAIRAPLPAPPAVAAPALPDRALLARFDPFFPARVGSGETLPVTSLPFSLHGVRADAATGRGSAIIAAGDGQQLVYLVGESIAEGVTLAAIAADHVVLDRGGTREALWLDSAGPNAPARRDETAYEPLSVAVDETESNLPPSDSPAPPPPSAVMPAVRAGE
ncbi:MAG: type II secretion system protein N [Sphingomonadaceae bacterium]